MSKELAVMIPFVLFLTYFLIYPRFNISNVKNALISILPHLSLVVIYVWIRLVNVGVTQSGPYAMRFNGKILENFGKYIFWSMGRMDILMSLLQRYTNCRFDCIVAILVLIGLIYMFKKYRNETSFAVLWFIICLAPVMPVVEHAQPYYVNVPLLGISFLLATALDGKNRKLSLKTDLIKILMFGLLLGVSLIGINDEMKYSWVPRRAEIAKNAITAVQSAYPALPEDASLYLVNTDDDAYWAYNFGDVFRIYYKNDNLNVLFNKALPARALQHHCFVFQYYRGMLFDITKDTRPVERRYQEAILHGRGKSYINFADPHDEAQLGSGWYASEGTHRWMSKKADLFLGVPKPEAIDHELRLSGMAILKYFPARRLKMTIFIDGTKLSINSIEDEGGFDFRIPFRKKLSEICRIEIRLNDSFVPDKFNHNGDSRELGLVLSKIELR